MPDFVRIRDKGTGHESTVSRARADRLGDAVEVLDSSAVDALGRPLPAKPASKPTKTADMEPVEALATETTETPTTRTATAARNKEQTR